VCFDVSVHTTTITFRNLYQGGGNAADAQLKALQDSIAKAQAATAKEILKSQRDITRRIEESHDWLCSLSDNAITASEGETILKGLSCAKLGR
jgi:predicted metallo-beta-lactamase superfamily hydrolase